MRSALLQFSSWFGLVLGGLCFSGIASAADVFSVQSHSGQFTVAGPPLRPSTQLSPIKSGKTGVVQLEPNLTAVSAERVKAAVWRSLGVSGMWRGKIRIALVSGLAPGDNVRLASTLYPEGWQYRLEIPREIVEENFVRAITKVVLLEVANRQSSGRCAEVPWWLSEGLTQYLIASEPDLVLQAETVIMRSERRADPLQRARASLGQRSPLTFNELSWPSPDDLQGERREVFQRSAHFFLTAIMRSSDGASSLRKFVESLAQHLNWQTAFLRGFAPRFTRLIDVEKWWAVTVCNFSGRNEWQVWPPETALEKIDESLMVEAELRMLPNAVPVHTVVPLAAVLQEWNAERQEPALRYVINTLAALRLNVPGELVQLIDDYRVCLEEYLQRRARVGVTSTKGQVAGRSAAAMEEAVRRLGVLDQRREMWRREYAAASAKPGGRGP